MDSKAKVQALIDEQLETGYRYQQFGYGPGGLEPGGKVKLKLKAWGGLFPEDLRGKRVLDIGANLGFFTFLAALRGAEISVGIEPDPRRRVWAKKFRAAALDAYGHQGLRNVAFGSSLDAIPVEPLEFDVILLWSVYHHIFRALPRHDVHFARYRSLLRPGGVLLFEGPFHPGDYILRRIGISESWKRGDLEDALTRHFSGWRYVGPALHTGGRECAIAGVSPWSS